MTEDHLGKNISRAKMNVIQANDLEKQMNITITTTFERKDSTKHENNENNDGEDNTKHNGNNNNEHNIEDNDGNKDEGDNATLNGSLPIRPCF